MSTVLQASATAPSPVAPAAARSSSHAATAGGTFAGGASVGRTVFTLLVGAVLGGLVVAAGFLTFAWYAAAGVPDFYSDALSQAPPAERRAAADAFEAKTAELTRAARYREDWEQQFTQAQINGWLAERLQTEFGDEVPDDVSDPRVDLSRPGLVRLGFRLSNSKVDGIVSLAVRPEVVGPNRVALHIQSLWLGRIPLDPSAFRGNVSKQLDRYEIEHEWADPPADSTRPTPPVLTVAVAPLGPGRPVLEELEIDGSAVRVAGRRAAAVRLTRR